MAAAVTDSNGVSGIGRGAVSGTWVVMGGGAAKGLAHVGAWKAIQEAGISVAGIIGTSTGAMMGAAVAAGRTVEEMEERSERLRRRDIMRVNRRAVWVNGIRSQSVFRGDILRQFIEDLLPTDDWRELTIPLMVNAVDLASGEMVWFGQGGDQDAGLVDSVHASAALPVLFPPVVVGERMLVDGGVLDTLPIERAAEMGATRIIAIDVGAGPHVDARVVVDGGLIADTDGFDFKKRRFFIEEGYRATSEALAVPAPPGG